LGTKWHHATVDLTFCLSNRASVKQNAQRIGGNMVSSAFDPLDEAFAAAREYLDDIPTVLMVEFAGPDGATSVMAASHKLSPETAERIAVGILRVIITGLDPHQSETAGRLYHRAADAYAALTRDSPAPRDIGGSAN
jgi:hypothetical protein